MIASPAGDLSPSGLQESSGTRIALELTSQNNRSLSGEQLQQARDIGIDALVISDPGQLAGMDPAGFLIFLNAGYQYPSVYKFQQQMDVLIAKVLEQYRATEQAYPGQIAAVEVFRYPNDKDRRFGPLATQFADSIAQYINRPLYYTSAYPDAPVPADGFQFRSVRYTPPVPADAFQDPSVQFLPSENIRESLRSLEILFGLQTESESVIVLPSEWFFDRLEHQPELEYVISSYIDGSRVAFPLPAESEEITGMNWGVLLLFLIWMSVFMHLKFQPIYSQSLPRYFFSHTFLVLDVMEHRIRNSVSGFIVLIQHALLTGLFFYVSAEILISETGLNLLVHYFPYLFPFANPLLSLFFMGVILAFILQLISVFWIYILNREMKYLRQTLNLYSLPLHINLLTVTLLVVFNQVGLGEFWMAALSILFAVVWFCSFNMAAIDGAKFLSRYKFLNILLTVGLHTLLIFGLAWAVINMPQIYEPLQMAVMFP